MNRVADILSRKNATAISVNPDASVFDALKIMAEKNIGSLMVMDGDKYLGLVTERDYSRKVVLKGKQSESTKVSEIMTDDLPNVMPEDTVEHCMELMTANNIRYLPVFENDKLVGIISMSDVVKDTISTQKETISHLETYINSGL